VSLPASLSDAFIRFSIIIANTMSRVLWFNLGMHHMPHTGDLPTTMFTATRSAMRFEPLNYLDGDPSVASNQQVRIDYNDDGSISYVEEFGKEGGAYGTCA
jgi:primary-amine oxidase